MLVTVGELAAAIARAARTAGMAHVSEAGDAAEALVILRRVLRPGDTVLVKGSRALELERVVVALTRAEPAAARP